MQARENACNQVAIGWALRRKLSVRECISFAVLRSVIGLGLYVESYPESIGFSLLRSVIGLENWRHFLNQSDAKSRFPALDFVYMYLL